MTNTNSVYQIVTDRIIEQLKQGVAPWRKPWIAGKDAPHNLISRKAYRGVNRLILPYPGAYATFKQIQAAGGHVKKGSTGHIVVFWKMLEVENKDTSDMDTIPMLRYYKVFHIATQTEGIEITPDKDGATDVFTPDGDAESIAADYITREGIRLDHIGADRACYSPIHDVVTMPEKSQFKTAAGYYSTLYHELTHSTGHKSRLGRFAPDAMLAAFGSPDYSKEELVAEVGAAAALHLLEIETQESAENNAAYCKSWLTALQNDAKMIVTAAGKAEKAVDLIFGREA